jgi:hypothetical protein
MSTKSYTLILYHLQDHNIQSLEKEVFFHVLEGYNNVLGAKKTIFSNRHGSMDSKLLFLCELGT